LRRGELPIALQPAHHANAQAVGVEALGVCADLGYIAPGEDLATQVDAKVVANGAQAGVELRAGLALALETAIGMPAVNDLRAVLVTGSARHAQL
jgi:hypothetical protein